MDFFFKKSIDANWKTLCQGDILNKTEELKSAISEAHPYYSDKTDYTHFMVLTQSCDLVRRIGKAFKARYITICAVRPLGTFTDQALAPLCHKPVGENATLRLVKKETKETVEQKLERLLNNTEPGHFFIRAGSHTSLSTDLVVYLQLSIALNQKHYDTCLKAKTAELEDTFQAKVGWLVGNDYSRVGTKDISDAGIDPKKLKSEFIDDVLGKSARFLSGAEYGRLKKELKDIDDPTNDQVIEALDKLELDDKFAAGSIASEIVTKLKLDEDNIDKIRNVVSANKAFKKAFN